MSGGNRIVRAAIPLVFLMGGARAVEAQKTHEVKLEGDREKEVYRFVPSSLTASPSDVIVFKVSTGAPHSIVFDDDKFPAPVKNALSSALGSKSDAPASPLLTKNGSEYRFVLPKLPPGTYRFFCLPHRAYDMRGEIIVGK